MSAEEGLTDSEKRSLRGFVAGGNRMKIAGEWVPDQRTQALYSAVERILADRAAPPEGTQEVQWAASGSVENAIARNGLLIDTEAEVDTFIERRRILGQTWHKFRRTITTSDWAEVDR